MRRTSDAGKIDYEQILKKPSKLSLPFIVGLIVLLSATGCSKKSGIAVVLGKEHIDAREATPVPKAEPSSSPNEPAAGESASTPGEEIVRVMREDEVDVDGYVMKKQVRGTSRDPRATDHECWIVNVQMVADLRRFNVPTDNLHWEKVKIGDRIKVSYRQGNYTGTVWSAEID